MSSELRASVVVVAYNSARDLPGCLESLLPTLGPDDEVLVYDNASCDGSSAVAGRYPVRTVRSDENRGFGGANNRAAALTAGRYLVFLNPDTAVEPGWLDPLLEAIGDGPGLATSKIVLMDDPGRIDTCANRVHLSGVTVCRGHGQPATRYGATERVLAVSGAAFAVDRATWERLGGFDERFFMYLEDTDLSLRAALAGVPCWYVGSSRVRHRHVPRFGPRKIYWLERNRWLMVTKLWSGRTFVGLLPTLGLLEMLTWGYALLGGPSALRERLRASTWVLGHLPELFAARSRVQRARTTDDASVLARADWRLDLAEIASNEALARFLGWLLTPVLFLSYLVFSAVVRRADSGSTATLAGARLA